MQQAKMGTRRSQSVLGKQKVNPGDATLEVNRARSVQPNLKFAKQVQALKTQDQKEYQVYSRVQDG